MKLLNIKFKLECPQGMKQCSTTGQCFPARKWCDKVFDCADFSDEAGCGKLQIKIHFIHTSQQLTINVACAPSDIKCQEGYCKSGDSYCNGINDCKDFSDELDCGKNNSFYLVINCTTRHFLFNQNVRTLNSDAIDFSVSRTLKIGVIDGQIARTKVTSQLIAVC